LRVKDLVKNKMKKVIPTFFTVMVKALRLWRILGEEKFCGVTPRILGFLRKLGAFTCRGCHLGEGKNV
jgi:hypothetical protein